MNPFNWTQVVFIKLINKLLKIVYYLKYKLLKTYCFKFDVHVVILNFLYYMKFIRVSATPYSNYSLLCILLLKVFCSTNGTWYSEFCTICNLELGTIWYYIFGTLYYIFPIVILCCILGISYCISYDIYEVLFIKLSTVEYNDGKYCKKYC